MAKRISLEPQALIPESERGTDHPLTLYYRPMTKRQRDEYDSRIYALHFGEETPPDPEKIEAKALETALRPGAMTGRFKVLLDCALVPCPDDGAFIANVENDTMAAGYESLTSKAEAITFILDELDPDVADEIQNQLQEALGLTERERKNS